MKKKISRILGVALTLALLSSLTMVAAPVSAGIGDDDNTWGAVGMPAIAPETEVGVMAIAPDGTIYAAIFYESNYATVAKQDTWDIMKSIDGGFKWTATELTGLVDYDGDIWDWDDNGRDQMPVDIVIAADGTTVYVACINGDIFRLEDAGTAIPILLKEIVDSYGDTLDDSNGFLYDIDIWYDGSDNWIMAACDMDVLVLRDNLWFEDWRDQELATAGNWGYAVQANFAPDFNSSGLIWAIAGDPWLYLTSTISPGQWGNTIKEVTFENQDEDNNWWSPYVDIAFPGNYISTAPLLYVAIAEDDFDDEGNLYMVQGALVSSTALTEADPLLPDDLDVGSVEVSGNVIMVVDTWNGDVWVSYNAGDTFDLAVRGPSGWFSFWGHVYMAPGAFDPDEGVAYFTSIDYGFGQSALSRTDDGGATWDQISWVDTYIDWIFDVAFSPEGASQPALLLTGDSDWPWVDSLWQTADATAASPQWVRVATNQNLGVNFLEKVEYALDGSAIMLFVDDGDWEIYKSTDDANTFTHWRDLPNPVGYLNDWVVANSATIYTACTGGYYGTSIFGPATLELLGGLNSIAVFGDTIAVGGEDGFALDGMVVASIDAGENWGTPASVGAGDVFVTFGPDGTLYAATSESEVLEVTLDDDEIDDFEAVEDEQDPAGTAEATSFSGIWVSPDNALYAIGGDTITNPAYDEPAEVSGTIDLLGDNDDDLVVGVEPDVNGVVIALQGIDNVVGTFVDAEGLTISASTLTAVSSTIVSGTIYLLGGTSAATGSIDVTIFTAGFTMGEGVTIDFDTLTVTVVTVPEATIPGDTDLFRLLIGEDDNVWETAEQDGAFGLWGTTGTNILWTVVDGDALYALEDTLSGPVTGVVVSIIGENSAKVSWSAMVGTSLKYEYEYDSAGGITASTSKTLTLLTDDKEYDVKVRVAPQPDSPWSSRWSSEVTFATLETILAPVNRVPFNGMQDAPLLPSFVWDTVPNAEYYDFQLSTGPTYTAAGFTSTVEVAVITAPTTAYTCTTELAYDTNHYWIVRAVSTDSVSGIDAVSDWCFFNFHTMVEPIPPVTVEPAPTPTIILPTPTVTVVPPDITVVPPDIIVVPPDITVDIPQPTITTVQPIIEIPPDVAPAYIWVIVAIGALLVIAVIILIIRTRRVV